MTPRPRRAAKIRTASYPKRFHKRRSGLRCFIVRLSCKNFRVARPRGAKRNGCRRLLPYRFASDTNARAKNFSRGELIDRPRSARPRFKFILRFFLWRPSWARPLALSARRREYRRAKRRNRPSHIERSLPFSSATSSALIETEILRARRSNTVTLASTFSPTAKRSVF